MNGLCIMIHNDPIPLVYFLNTFLNCWYNALFHVPKRSYLLQLKSVLSQHILIYIRSQVAERLGNLASNQNVAGLISGRAE